MAKKRVAIIGAGPGGLTSAMILAHRGCDVRVFEREARVGGRNGSLELNGYKFDIGPTFLMMKFLLDEVFRLAGKNSEDYLTFHSLDPIYRLDFEDFRLDVTRDHGRFKSQIREHFPGEEDGLDAFMQCERKRFQKMKPCLEVPYSDFSSLFSKNLLRALPHLSLGRTIFTNLGRYFGSEKLKICFTFQAKYLGMSPWRCPAAFTILPFVEHEYGVYHVQGGLSEISVAMARAAEEEGGKIYTGAPVNQVLVKDGAAVGVELTNGEKVEADVVIINADFAHAMTHLFPPGVLRKYTPRKLSKKDYSCSTFMLYLGLSKLYDEQHHAIIFSSDYRKNIEEITEGKLPSEDFSLYVRNASITDPTLAPAGKSAVYVLVPMPNNKSGVDWQSVKDDVRRQTLSIIKDRTSMKDIEEHIEVERTITPADWEKSGIYYGATFNLAHTLGQMLYFRPHNKFEEVKHCYLVGGGTHPGSGLPTIYESGRIAADLITGSH